MTVHGLLLAAGAGSRMGTPKALVRGDDGEPWLVRGVRTLVGGGCTQVDVVLGASAEEALARAGRYPDDRSDDKGAEFEGAEVAVMGHGRSAVPYAFIGSERGDAVLVQRMDHEDRPRLVQVLATGTAPEGVLAVPSRGLHLTANEDDGTISVFALRERGRR